MGDKVFAAHNGVKLRSDKRDIAVSVMDSDEIIRWCIDNNIGIQRVNHGFGLDIWRIKDEQQRMMFLLKFGELCS